MAANAPSGDEDVELQNLRPKLNRMKSQRSIDPTNVMFWENVFERMDLNGDGKVSYEELKLEFKKLKASDPKRTARLYLRKADTNNDGTIDKEEFFDMLTKEDFRHLFYRKMKDYVTTVVPNARSKLGGTDDVDAEYEDQYSCCPPPLTMIIISIIEIIAFCYDAAVLEGQQQFSETTAVLIYNPHRRAEAWRFFSYMFVHNGIFHLLVNLLVQIILGVPLEMVHRGWRISLLYLAGVVAGSLGTSISDPSVYLAGASGGVYALLTAHISTIILNWKEMQFAIGQLLIFLVIVSVDIGTAIYNRYIVYSEESEKIGYAAHVGGAIAGLLLGINILRNLEVTSWEKKLWWAALIVYVTLMLAAIIWNAAFPSYFPVQYV